MLQELTALRQQQKAEELAADADKIGFAHDTAWQLVQLAERVVEFRAATGGQAVPLADWRSWLSLFLAGERCAALLLQCRPESVCHCAAAVSVLCSLEHSARCTSAATLAFQSQLTIIASQSGTPAAAPLT